ncbi:xanthine dehydrogenase family protein molybdopterin-binding subunit [Roseobacter sp. HKCCA0434]|uniref:xanthine dehydrogenase family protein molybdopterin-binding subunit n=1 Tax=Roseobacter sp. HKCCA0434 TaxID=3079297 RepID=UPI002905AD1E|nr:xanthine dehydrogenase family protein molybdopterin-binding subunit [Roseobacter sp. HKCCA0434]
MKFGIGQSARRIEDPRLLKGEGRFVDDAAPEGSLWMQVIRSDVAHGDLAPVDLADALAMPDVVGGFTAGDISGRLSPISAAMPLKQADGTDFADLPQPHLAQARVLYVGQPVAVLFARSRRAALDAAEQVFVEVEERPALVTATDAKAGAPLHDGLDGNVFYRWQVGDAAAVDAAFAAAEHRIAMQVRNQRLAVSPVEPRGIRIRYDEAEGWDLTVSNQGVHAIRNDLARDLGVPTDRIRVHAPDVGGAFGLKLIDHPEYALACLGAQQFGAEVRWTSTRSEALLTDLQARDLDTQAEAAFDAEGRLTGLRWRSTSNVGAFVPGYGAAVHTAFSGHLIGGLYDVAAVDHVVEGVVTNTAPVDAYRGAGKPEVLHVMERLMDRAATKIGLDPVEIRRRNLIRPEQIPYVTAGGIDFDALDAPAILDLAVEKADLAGYPARRAEAEAQGLVAGLGLACYYERTGGGPVEMATVEIGADGRTLLDVGTQSGGQGHETAWAQIVSDRLGLDPATMRLATPDSARLPDGGGTGGSRSAVQASRSFLLACEDVVKKAKAAAEDLLEVAAADLTFEDGRITVAGTDRSMTLVEIARATGGLTGAGDVNSKITTTPNGTHVAEILLDPETGRVTLDRYTVVDDFGHVINPMLVEGQVHGGVAQGIGQVLCEAVAWDADGQPLTGSFMDYALPRAADLSMIDVAFHAVPTPSNPLGLKGAGEAGSVAAVPATANAVCDALARLGVDDLAPPYTPGRVWAALDAVRKRDVSLG